MKKYIVMPFVLVLFALSVTTTSFAEDLLSTAGANAGQLNIGSSAASATLNIGLSPKVVARYVSPGNSTVTAQWYAVAAAHPGGNKKYATGQNLNNIGSANYVTGTTLDNTVLAIPTTQASQDAFTTLLWEF